MNIIDKIGGIFRRGANVLVNQSIIPFSQFAESRMPFGIVVFQNIVELLTDITNDVMLVNKKPTEDVMRFALFKAFFDSWGKFVLTRLYLDGFVVIGYSPVKGFRVLGVNEYMTISTEDKSIVKPLDDSIEVYVMKSSMWMQRTMSDRQFLNPFIEFLDNVLNASNTASARLGNLVVASPANGANAPTAVVLNEKQKDELEEQMQKEYGALREQKQIMLLPRQMNFQTISLAGLDMRTTEKARLAILAICDRIKVPANQVAIIDANSSKSLSNGSELREGDFNKYQSFERLLNQTFIKMANDMNIAVDYTIYNKPQRVVAAQ